MLEHSSMFIQLEFTKTVCASEACSCLTGLLRPPDFALRVSACAVLRRFAACPASAGMTQSLCTREQRAHALSPVNS
jgi:hypothetical protein